MAYYKAMKLADESHSLLKGLERQQRRVVNTGQLTKDAEALENAVRAEVGRDNLHVDLPPAKKLGPSPVVRVNPLRAARPQPGVETGEGVIESHRPVCNRSARWAGLRR